MSRVELEWFDKRLNPNMKTYWRKVNTLRGEQKLLALIAARSTTPIKQGTYPLKITFYPPCRRRRDLDNCLASIKGALDGIAQAWGVDDRLFRPIHADFGDKCDDGKIIVEVV